LSPPSRAGGELRELKGENIKGEFRKNARDVRGGVRVLFFSSANVCAAMPGGVAGGVTRRALPQALTGQALPQALRRSAFSPTAFAPRSGSTATAT
jgi:hypothetical protein